MFGSGNAYLCDMSVQIKICGLKTAEDVNCAVEAGANFVGFVFFEASPRNISLTEATKLRKLLPADVAAVAVTVNAEDDLLSALFKNLQPDFVQMHGNESPARVKEVQSQFGCGIIKALSIDEPQQFDATSAYDVDYFLFDAKPMEQDLPGGLGKSFDWSLLSHYHGDQPWFLAGGLTPENVAEAILKTGARAIDVSSGVEKAPGIKDPTRITKFIENAHKALAGQ